MFPKHHRATYKNIQPARAHTHTIHTPYFSLRVGAKTNNTSTVAIIVSKKVAPRAVDRNRIKRRIRHALSPNTLQPHTYLIYTKKQALTLTSEQLKEELQKLLR